jgi:hypothetical protein
VAVHEGSGRSRKTSRSRIGIIALAVASEALGLLMGQWFFGIYQQTVPPAVVTGFNITTAHGYFLVNGAIAGLVLFVWAMLAVWLAPFFRKPSPSA